MGRRRADRLRNVSRAFEFFVPEKDIAAAVGEFDFAVSRDDRDIRSRGVRIFHFHAERIVIRFLRAVSRNDRGGVAESLQPLFQRENDVFRIYVVALFRYIVRQREIVRNAALQIPVQRDRAEERLVNFRSVFKRESELREREHRQNDEHYTDDNQ